jgi:hypothetical protein
MKYSKVIKLAKIFVKNAYINENLSDEELKEVVEYSRKIFDERKAALISMKDEDPEFFSKVVKELKDTIAEVKSSVEADGLSQLYMEAELMNIAAEVLDYPEIIERINESDYDLQGNVAG